MGSPWRWTLHLILFVLYRSNVAVFSQDQPASKPLSILPMRNRENVQPFAELPPQLIQQMLNTMQGIGEQPDIQSGNSAGSISLLPGGNSALPSLKIVPLHVTCPPNQQPLTLMPIQHYNMPLQSSSPPFTFPLIVASMVPPGSIPPPIVPSSPLSISPSQLITSMPPPELTSIYCPPLTSPNPSRIMPLFQPQIPIDDFQQSLSFSDIGSQPSFQYINYPPVSTCDSLRIVPLSQSQILPLEKCSPIQILPDSSAPSFVQLRGQNYPLATQYEPFVAPYVPSISRVHEDNFFANIPSNVNNPCPPFYQVTSLPPVQPTVPSTVPIISERSTYPSSNVNNPYPPFYQVTSLPQVQPTLPFVPEHSAYPSNQYVNTFQTPITSDAGNSQLPITLQINIPESPAPIISIISPMPPYSNAMPPSVPPYAMSPIIIEKRKSRWKNWLPAFILALFTSNRGNFGYDSGGSCCYCCCRPNTSPENVYIPYPIPISTNNPIICNKGSSGKGRRCDNIDEGVQSD